MFQICIALYIIFSICNLNEYFMFNIYFLVFLFEYCVINNNINVVILLSINKEK